MKRYFIEKETGFDPPHLFAGEVENHNKFGEGLIVDGERKASLNNLVEITEERFYFLKGMVNSYQKILEQEAEIKESKEVTYSMLYLTMKNMLRGDDTIQYMDHKTEVERNPFRIVE